MPYIPRTERPIFDKHIVELARFISVPGQLTYVICKLLDLLWRRSFYDWCVWRGAIEEAIVDFRQRKIEPYEEMKREENGDVY